MPSEPLGQDARNERRSLGRARRAAAQRQRERDQALAEVSAGLNCTYCHAPLKAGNGRFCDQNCKERWEDLTLCW
jgi:hypothetical protein